MEMLEPYDGKLSRMVLRGRSGREASELPGMHEEEGGRDPCHLMTMTRTSRHAIGSCS